MCVRRGAGSESTTLSSNNCPTCYTYIECLASSRFNGSLIGVIADITNRWQIPPPRGTVNVISYCLTSVEKEKHMCGLL